MAFWFEFDKISDLPNNAGHSVLDDGSSFCFSHVTDLTTRFFRGGLAWLSGMQLPNISPR
ncbi:hypothetical protein AGRHK599_LOCUS5103 [Rhizobium rhizogenes]|uniref:Uncharacterized protein n=1 Tax=Rhizobium rhizogenes TaxID=359 RepID=A0AAN2A8W3_RHIRH|nr:hypothetical protein B0909_24445 [Rhizobium rhizogenes]CAD0217550.1 hypothetical protein AGRHK599_LOCUS5103 [Rhizobium rhizogenes]